MCQPLLALRSTHHPHILPHLPQAMGKRLALPEHRELLHVLQCELCPAMLSGYEAELAAGGCRLEQASGSSWAGQACNRQP